MITTPPKPPVRPAIGLFFGFAAASALLFWIVNGVAPWDSQRNGVWHHYEYLTDGFLQGHTYLSVTPAPELLKLKDPFDPNQNAAYRLLDASLYQKKYYLYFGPTPALLLMLPWRVIAGEHLPQRLAVGAFAIGGLAGLALLLWEIRQRYFPQLSGCKLGLILFVSMHAAWLPVTLRRPAFWELPIVTAVACLWWTIYFFWRCHTSGGRTRWAVGAGFSLAFLLGARPTYVFTAGWIVGLLFLSGRRGDRTKCWPWPTMLAAGIITALGGIALLLYNHARFGNFLEFGQSYQLWGIETPDLSFFSASFIPFNLWLYIFSLPKLTPYFPFVEWVWPDYLPTHHAPTEGMHGALLALPVQLTGFIALGWIWQRRDEVGIRALKWTSGAASGALLINGGLLLCYMGTSSRYITEFFGGWTVVTAIGLMAIFALPSGKRRHGMLKLLTMCAAGWTIVYTWLASAEFRAFMQTSNPRTYTLAAHFLDYPSYWLMKCEGSTFGPLKLEVRLAPFTHSETIVLLNSGRPDMQNRLLLERIDADHIRLQLAENEVLVLTTPLLHLTDDRLHVGVSAPWLYPPPQHPYWDGFTKPATRRELQRQFAIAAAGQMVSVHSDFWFDSASFKPKVQDSPEASSVWVESTQQIVVVPH
ncbi:MAG TPA: hypothetical protein VK717_08720 [Opitutaceae bacterium]|jgi:hypothetical protein|nr:hypothetical protein [Opitutaceae bacterium]